MKKTLTAVMIAGLAIGLAGCGSSSNASTTTAPKEDILANSACDHFRNVAGDAAKGLLSDSELRDKLKQVYGDAQYATSAGIASGSQAMLSAITAGDMTSLKTAIDAFGASCGAIGH